VLSKGASQGLDHARLRPGDAAQPQFAVGAAAQVDPVDTAEHAEGSTPGHAGLGTGLPAPGRSVGWVGAAAARRCYTAPSRIILVTGWVAGTPQTGW
jgi:hypothetical protein